MIRNPHLTLEEMLPNTKPWHRNFLVISVTAAFFCLILTIIYTSYNVYSNRRGNCSSPYFTYTYDRTEVYYFDYEEKPSTTPVPLRIPGKFGISGRIITRTHPPPHAEEHLVSSTTATSGSNGLVTNIDKQRVSGSTGGSEDKPSILRDTSNNNIPSKTTSILGVEAVMKSDKRIPRYLSPSPSNTKGCKTTVTPPTILINDDILSDTILPLTNSWTIPCMPSS